MTSIRNRLLLWLLSALVVAVGIATVATGIRADHQIDDLFDYQLKQVAILLLHEPRPNVLEGENTGPSADRDDDIIAEVRTVKGRLLYASRPALPLPQGLPSGYSEMPIGKTRYRIYVTRNHYRRVEVAQAISAREELAADMAMQIAWQLLGLIPVLAVLIWIAVGKGMQPLAKITRSLKIRDSYVLDPLPEVDLPQEIRPMVEALNDLLKRLGEALETQRRFTADAAHELRTPLAAVQLQAQIVERATDDRERRQALTQLKGGIRRSAHLVQQLLTLSRLDPKMRSRQAKTSIGLGKLLHRCMTDLAPLADAKGIEMTRGEVLPLPILADEESILVLLNNLLDKAIRYTPKDGKVEAGVSQGDRNGVLLWVADSGPGIPETERERVFDRFYRCLGSSVTGSGLGLAIVKNICEDHHACITLGDSAMGGLRVSVWFPPL